MNIPGLHSSAVRSAKAFIAIRYEAVRGVVRCNHGAVRLEDPGCGVTYSWVNSAPVRTHFSLAENLILQYYLEVLFKVYSIDLGGRGGVHSWDHV